MIACDKCYIIYTNHLGGKSGCVKSHKNFEKCNLPNRRTLTGPCQTFQLYPSGMWRRHSTEEYPVEVENRRERTDLETRSGVLSVMATSTDKPTLGDNASATKRSNHSVLPLISGCAQSVGMFTANSWETLPKRGGGRHSHLYHCTPAEAKEGAADAQKKGREREHGRFKHTRAGIACQNILPSSNWVIFDTPCWTVPAYWWGRVRVPRACKALLAPNQSRHQRCPQTIWQARVHTQARDHPKTRPNNSRLYHRGVIGTWAFRSVFKGGNLIHICTMKLAILYPAPNPPSSSFAPGPNTS